MNRAPKCPFTAGGRGYASLKEALKHIPQGEGIALGACAPLGEKVEIRKDVVIDLNGQTLRRRDGGWFNVFEGSLTIRNGVLDGGGLRTVPIIYSCADLSLEGVTVRNCAGVYNPCVCCSNGTAKFEGCSFEGNRMGNGQVIVFDAKFKKALIKGCIFKGNLGDYGACIYTVCPASIEGCSFFGNRTKYYGVVHNDSLHKLIIWGTSFKANESDGDCSGVYSSRSLEMRDCELIDNTAKAKGGALYNSKQAHLTRCIIKGNEAEEGGGVCNWEGELTLTECVVTQNKAQRGGGVFNNKGHITNNNSTIQDNTPDNLHEE